MASSPQPGSALFERFDAERRAVLERKLQIEREKRQRELDESLKVIRRDIDSDIRNIKNQFKLLAVTIPPIPPLLFLSPRSSTPAHLLAERHNPEVCLTRERSHQALGCHTAGQLQPDAVPTAGSATGGELNEQ